MGLPPVFEVLIDEGRFLINALFHSVQPATMHIHNRCVLKLQSALYQQVSTGLEGIRAIVVMRYKL